MADSSQRRVGRVRPPRVQITYDVEDGGAVSSRELPMVVGVVSDLAGDNNDPAEYKDRKFVEVGQGEVDSYMNRVNPTLKFAVSDEISGEADKELGVDLSFKSLDDFSPMGVAAQVPQTAKLLEARRKLADLYSKIESNDQLEGILAEVLADADKQDELRQQLAGLAGDDEGGDS